MRHLSLACMTLVGVTPPELVDIAAAAGYQGVTLSTGLSRIDQGGRIHSLVADPALRRETARRIAKTGVGIDLVEGIAVSSTFDLAESRDALDVMGELGATRFNTTNWDSDPQRASENLSALCELAAERHMGISIEFTPLSQLPSLAAAVELIREGKHRGLKILVDSLHLARAGETPEQVARMDSGLIAFAQICDGPLISPGPQAYWDEAIFERSIPGEGELPLKRFLEVLAPDVIVSPEVPQRSLRERGVSPLERARRVMSGVRRLLDQTQQTALGATAYR